MYSRGSVCILFWLCITVFNCTAQQWHLSYYTVNEGMVSNYVTKIFQDSRGFIWISTFDGLSKYDGHRFTNFTTANGLPHNLVNDIIELKDGRMYMACNDGSVALMQQDRISKVMPSVAVINKFYKTTTGKILAVTDRQGIQEFNEGKLHKPSQPFPYGSYFSMTTINDSLLLAGSDSSIQVFTNDLRLVKQFTAPVFYGENRVFKDSRGRLWASHFPQLAMLSMNGVVPLPASFHSLNPLSINRANIKQIFEDKEGNNWFPGGYGLIQLDRNDKVKIWGKKNGLLSDNATYLFQDREDNLWIGTSLGLCKMQGKNTVTLFNGPHELTAMNGGFIFAESENKFLAGTRKGWQYFNKETGEWSDLKKPTNKLYVIQKHLQGQPVLLTDDGLPILTNTRESSDLQNFLLRQPEMINHAVKDDDGNFFMADNHHLYIYDGRKVYADSVISNTLTTCMAIERKGALWMGTWANGVVRVEYKNRNGMFRIVKKETLLANESIRSLFVDKNGNIWAGSRYNGLFHLSPDNKGNYKAEQWNTKKGLSSNWVMTIAGDARGNIWLGYTYGLDKLVKKTDSTYRVFNFSRVNNFFGNIYQILPDNGNLWLITYDGLALVKDNEMENKTPWPVYITRVSIGDSTYVNEAMPATLAYGKNSLRFDFTSPTYTNEKQVLYSYRLGGSDDTAWSSPQNLHSVSFASLSPGHYRFEVRMLGWNGQWGQSATANFTILPPLWRRTWFVALVFLLLAAVVAWLMRRRIKLVKHEAEMKQQLAETEMMALRAQMNPHFLFNSLNAIDSLIQTRQHDKATTYLGRFARLLRLVLDSSKNKLVPFDKDFTAMQLYLDMEKFRSGDKFQFDINAEHELLNGGYSIPPLLVQPFIENAIYHGLMNKRSDDRRLTVNASLQDEFIVFNITDNGVGRIRSKDINAVNRPEHVSYGWQITIQRLGLHNGGNGEDYIIVRDLYEDNEPRGTHIEMKIKVNAY
ncbi:MAG TPA: two-component regulator propeller domain-containing protein [Chitinophagaceae bacterium]|nr:two-component regulator propeller domain-containing protein [Chitinophagaceae bacterium]